MTAASQGLPAVRRSPVAVFPMAGRCTVCGHHADTLVMFPNHREVRHRPGGGRACVLPNPPVVQKAEVSS